MPLYRVIPNGDLDLVTGDNGLKQIVVLTGAPFVRQKIATRLRFFLGEWFLNLREGIPYYRIVLVANPDMGLIRTLFSRVILSVQEVAVISKLVLSFDEHARTLAVEFDAQLVAGGVLLIRQPDPAFLVQLATAA